MVSFQSGNPRNLNGLKCTGIDVTLYLAQSADYIRTTDRKPDTPTCHIIGLGKGVKLDSDRLSPFHLKKTHRPITIKGHLGIGSVVTYDNIMFPGKGDHRFKEILGSHCCRGIVWIVYKHHLGLLGHFR